MRQRDEYEVTALVTTINQQFRRIAIHGYREALLEEQAKAAGLPVWKVDLPFPCTNGEYEARMALVFARAAVEHIDGIAFGDLFLEEIRAYRLKQLEGTGLKAIFPVWGIPTDDLAEQMVASGLRGYLTCVDPRVLNRSYAGRRFDAQLLRELPPGVDRCGERGEFHTFACEGPMFSRSIGVRPGEVVERDGFVYADLLPATGDFHE